MRTFKTVCVSGYFDPLHVGHIDYLQNSKLLGDRLVVILNNDTQRSPVPRMTQEDRKCILESIRWVDQVVIATDDDKTVCQTLASIHPDIFAKGVSACPRELQVCEAMNIEVVTSVGGSQLHLQDLLNEFR